MTTYDTTTLAAAIIGEEKVELNRKSATRTLRKFLRDDFKAKELATPGKGGRYSIDLNKRDLTAMTKRFAAWEVAQAEAKAKRDAINAPAAPAEPIILTNDEDGTDEEALAENEASDKGPSDEEIAAMLADVDDEV